MIPCRSELVRETTYLTHRLANKLAPTWALLAYKTG